MSFRQEKNHTPCLCNDYRCDYDFKNVESRTLRHTETFKPCGSKTQKKNAQLLYKTSTECDKLSFNSAKVVRETGSTQPIKKRKLDFRQLIATTAKNGGIKISQNTIA